jgi:hypothetical protein
VERVGANRIGAGGRGGGRRMEWSGAGWGGGRREAVVVVVIDVNERRRDERATRRRGEETGARGGGSAPFGYRARHPACLSGARGDAQAQSTGEGIGGTGSGSGVARLGVCVVFINKYKSKRNPFGLCLLVGPAARGSIGGWLLGF